MLRRDPGREAEPIAEMNVIPFIDICLVLLIIVLVTATFSTPLLDFDHPKAAGTEFVEDPAGVTVLEVGADGHCRLGGRPVDLASLRAELASREGTDVVLRASPRVPSRHVVAAAEQVRAAGRGRLAFALAE